MTAVEQLAAVAQISEADAAEIVAEAVDAFGLTEPETAHIAALLAKGAES